MNDQQLITKLHNKGYKVTPQRLAICKMLLSSKDHPSAEQIYQEVKKTHPTISLATVYITLDLLKKLSLVQELGFSDRSSRYDPNNSPHVNVICPKCGKIYDYASANIKKMLSQVVTEADLKPLRQRLDLYALCDKCSQENKQNESLGKANKEQLRRSSIPFEQKS